MKIAFMGTPEFAVRPLEALAAAGHEILAVYTQPPRPKGRGQHVQPSPVQIAAERLGIPVHTPLSFKKDAAARADFAALAADVAVVAAYGLILPQDVLDAPVRGCLNIHASLLPRWRGASPIQHAVLAGDVETGVTIMQMEAGLDTGPMIVKGAVPIEVRTTTTDLLETLSGLGARLIVEMLGKGEWTTEKQDDTSATYAPLLKKTDGQIDWTRDAFLIDRQIRALNPWPGVWTLLENGQRLKILDAEPIALSAGTPSELNINGIVGCGGGTSLLLQHVQPEGARAMDLASAMNGGYLRPEMRFVSP